MQIQRRTRKGFNFIAPFYDAAANIFTGNGIHRSQTWFLTKLSARSNVLIFGGGTGKFLIELMKNPALKNFCYVDISDKMVELARKKIYKKFPLQTSRVQFICGSYTEIPQREKFDLIITSYILDCFQEEELQGALNHLHAHHANNGQWLFVDFNIAQKPFSKFISIIIIWFLYAIFNAICGLKIDKLPGFSKEFNRLGYKPVDEKYFLLGLLVARIYEHHSPSSL